MKYSLFGIVTRLFLVALAFSCEKNTTYEKTLVNPELFHRAMKQLTDVIVHDIFSPPVASRIYAYPSIAAYEVIRNQYGGVSFSGQLNGLSETPKPDNENVNFHLAALHSFLTVGTKLIFSESKMESYQNELYETLDNEGLPKRIKEASLNYGERVANHILSWANEDMYNQTRTYPQYTIQDEPKYWKPTPPDYMQGIEPHWDKIRTMVLDSARQFKPKEPFSFSLDEKSEFYKQLMEVYEVGRNLNEEETKIAQFWDCNPYVSHHIGHVMFATKKITPGGHWVGITAIAARQAKSSFSEVIDAYAQVSIALFDAFISCWDEKWRSIVVRPETLITEYIDEEWAPLLQTPPFPEYTSGHSVISRAAAVTLTNIYGENFSFNDTTELEYGLPARQFDSFIDASEEAAISRLYGGIHYMMACENGVTQGQEVGEFIVSKLQSRKAAIKDEKEVATR